MQQGSGIYSGLSGPVLCRQAKGRALRIPGERERTREDVGKPKIGRLPPFENRTLDIGCEKGKHREPAQIGIGNAPGVRHVAIRPAQGDAMLAQFAMGPLEGCDQRGIGP